MFKEVQKNRKLYMLVVDQIKSLIDSEQLKCGEKLPSERDLSVEFGVSRSTVREAITALEIMNLVEGKLGLGTFVTECRISTDGFMFGITESDGISPSELFEARIILEPQLARLASQRATRDDLKGLSIIIEEAELLSDDLLEEFELLDAKFHSNIAKASYNDALLKFALNIENLRGSKLWGNMKLRSLQKTGRISKYKKEHRKIYDSLINRDFSQAEILTRQHLVDIRADIFENVD